MRELQQPNSYYEKNNNILINWSHMRFRLDHVCTQNIAVIGCRNNDSQYHKDAVRIRLDVPVNTRTHLMLVHWNGNSIREPGGTGSGIRRYRKCVYMVPNSLRNNWQHSCHKRNIQNDIPKKARKILCHFGKSRWKGVYRVPYHSSYCADISRCNGKRGGT